MAIKDSTDKLAQLAHAATQSDADYALRHRTICVPLASAIGLDSKRSFWRCDKDIRVKRATLIPTLALTSNDTNYDTYTFGYNDGAAGTVTGLATAFTTKVSGSGGTGDWVVGTAIALAGITDDDTVTAGNYLCLQTVKQGNGIAWGAILQVEVEYL